MREREREKGLKKKLCPVSLPGQESAQGQNLEEGQPNSQTSISPTRMRTVHTLCSQPIMPMQLRAKHLAMVEVWKIGSIDFLQNSNKKEERRV